MKALQALIAMVTESAVMIRNIVVDAFSPISLLEIDSINLALINIEAVATKVEQQAMECEAALVPKVEPEVEERKASFWKTIEKNYNGQKGDTYPPCSLRSLEGRWQDIKEQVGKFERYYNTVLCENHNGFIDSDKISKLLAIEEKKVNLKELREERERNKEDERIMGIDLSSCKLAQHAMYEAMQEEIFAHSASRKENRRTSK
ncbi:hypothetical protein BAE44_0020310 [Dichanthelium oligosanthes]|uniref:No apical meristem-associated C-terminal domain-containing protein n=1 Tax=Dichanthelium oligosanthes TaxID=888268 RepID=A0A1E5V0J4_9POAL|nr:hypothetical protein BAE44_0020310 [Dichanthelium oligosanthes]